MVTQAKYSGLALLIVFSTVFWGSKFSRQEPVLPSVAQVSLDGFRIGDVLQTPEQSLDNTILIGQTLISLKKGDKLRRVAEVHGTKLLIDNIRFAAGESTEVVKGKLIGIGLALSEDGEEAGWFSVNLNSKILQIHSVEERVSGFSLLSVAQLTAHGEATKE